MSAYPTTRVDENGRVCTNCHKYKPWSEFNFNCKGLNGYNPKCRECRNKTRHDNRHFHEYGLWPGQFEKIVEEQEGRCKICGVELELKGNKDNSVHIDHCHRTMKVRGLLCHLCNNGLAYFKENVSSLANAIVYVKENQ